MELKKIELEVPKEAHELAEAVADLVVKTIELSRDGFDFGEDLPVLVTEAFAKLPLAIEGLGKLGDEVKEPTKFTMAFLVAVEKIVAELLKKEEA